MSAARRVLFMLMLWPSLVWAQPMPTAPEGGSRPVPDPTLLTTQAQEKAIASQRELFETRIKAVEDEIKQRVDTLDRTDARVVKRLDDIQSIVDAAIAHQQQLTNEKFKGVDQQFQGRDVALAAALLAQKTSVDEQNKANAASSAKAEGATTKQIDGILSIIQANSRGSDDKIESAKQLVATQAKSTDDKITELRNTINTLQTSVAQITSRGAGQNDIWVYLVMGGSLLIAFAGIALPRMRGGGGDSATYHPPSYYPPSYPPPQYPPPQVSVVPVVPVNVPSG